MSYDSGTRVRPVLSGIQATALDMSFDETYLFATSNVTNTFKIYMYHESANVWTQEYSTTGPSGFGQDVSCTWDGDLVVVGSPLENNVYVYNSNSQSSNIWSNPVITRIESNAQTLAYHTAVPVNFGYSVSLSKNSGEYLAVGSPGDSTPNNHGYAWVLRILYGRVSDVGNNVQIKYVGRSSPVTGNGFGLAVPSPFSPSYPVVKDGTDYYYVTDSGHRIGHSVNISPYGDYLAIGAPGTPVSVINSSNTQHVTTGNPWSGYVNRSSDDYLQSIAMLGHIQVFIRISSSGYWGSYDVKTTYFITGESEQDLSTATSNPPYAWDFPSCGEKVKISTDGDYVIGGSPRYGFSGSQGGAHWGKIESWKLDNSTNYWKLSPGRVIGQQPGDRLGKYFDIDFAGKRLACLLLKAPSSYATPYGNTEGGIMVYDFNGVAFFETTTEITDTIGQSGNTDGSLGAICISRGNTLSVSGVNGGIIPSFYFKLTQTIDGNTLSGGYLAADTLVIGPNDGTTNNSYPKKLAFGGTYRDNSYEQTQIENRIYHYDSTNFSEWEQGYSELIFSKKSQREAQDMIRFKTHEFRVDSYVRDDGDYDHHPVITVNQQGLIKLNAEMHIPDNTSVHTTSEMQCNAKALLDIEGDCFTRRRLNIGWPEYQNVFGSDKWCWRILYDTRSPRVYNFEGSNQIHSNLIAINSTPWIGKFRGDSYGTISSLTNFNYSETECAFYMSSSSGFAQNNSYATNSGGTGHTLSFWFKLTRPKSSFTSNKTLISFGTPSSTANNGMKLELTSTTIIMNFGTHTVEPVTALNFDTNTWYHVYITFSNDNGDLGYIHINGTVYDTNVIGSTPSTTNWTKHFTIGSVDGDSITDCYIGMIAYGIQVAVGGPSEYIPSVQDMYLWGPPTQRLVVGGDVNISGDINFSGNIYQSGVLLSPWEANLSSYLYPITAMQGGTTSTGNYWSVSSGGYTASSSSIASTTYLAWKAFNHTVGSGDGWISYPRYQGGIYYIASKSTTYNGSSVIYGEWIQLQLPLHIAPVKIQIAPLSNYDTRCIKDGMLLGSNDGSTWTEIHSFTNQTYTTGLYTTISFTNTAAYSYFRLVCTEIEEVTTTTSFCTIGELKFVVDIDSTYVNNSVGIGTNLPNYELDVVGNVNISSNLYVSNINVSNINVSDDLNVSNINVFSTQEINNTYTSNNAYVNFINRTSYYENSLVVSSDIDVFDGFGTSVSVSGDGNTAVIGTPYTVANNVSNGGSVYIFVRSGNTWTQQAKLTSSDVANNDYLGISVSVSHDGNTFITGAYQEDPNSTTDGGSAYVFTRSGTTWTQQAKLVSSDVESNDQFGLSVSISGDGDTAIVGAYLEESVTPGYSSGSAYVFTRSGTSWSQQAKIVGSSVNIDEQFGQSVDISYDGNTVIIGNKSDLYAGQLSSGSATVFTRSGTTWTEERILIASDAGFLNQFGISVSISDDGNTALVGCFNKDTAYVFTRSGTTWSEEFKLIPWGNVSSTPKFGAYSVSLSGNGNVALVSAPQNSTQNNSYTSDGTTYVYVRIGTEWFDYTILSSLNQQNNGFFGSSVSTSYDGAISIVGASEETYYSNTSSGSVYTYQFTESLNYFSRLTVSNDLEVLGNIYGNGTTLSGIALETDMTSNASRISTLETDMTSNASRISTLETLTLEDITNNGNTTSNTIQFTNTSTSLVTSSNVGIGTINPAYLLDVAGNINFTGELSVNGSAGTSGQVLTSDGPGSAPTWTTSWIRTSTSKLFYNSGNVGIGLSNPAYTLEVDGDINFTGTLYQNGTAFSGGGSSPWTTSGSDIYYNSGNVGVGGLPYSGTKLNITSSNQAGLTIYDSQANPYMLLQAGGFGCSMGLDSINTKFIIRNSYNFSGNDRFNLDLNTGNLGLGTTTPSYKLDVAGDINFTSALHVGTNAGTSGQVLTSDGPGSAPIWTTSWIQASASKLFYNSGNVGIGLTNPAYTLEVDGDINFTGTLYQNGSAFSGGGSSPWTTSGSNIYYNSGNVSIGSSSSNGRLYIEPTGGSQTDNGIYVYNTNNSSGQDAIITLRTGGSSAGDPYLAFDINNVGSWACGVDNSDGQKFKWSTDWGDVGSTTKMTLDRSGNLGIGAPYPLHKLDVAGNINFTGALYVGYNAGTSGQVLTSDGAGSPPIWTTSWIRTSTSKLFYNSGNVGIGLSNPAYTLEVDGDINFTGYLSVNGNAGTSGQVLTSSGPGSAPTWTTVSGGSSVWTTSGSDIYYNSGNVGVGGLPYSGTKLNITCSNQAGLSIYDSSSAKPYMKLYTGGYDCAMGLDGFTGHFIIKKSYNFSSNDCFNLNLTNGNLGLGTTSPSYKLDVAGDINFTGTLYQNGSAFSGGGGSSVWTSGLGFIYYNSGSVGIGTSSPYRKLDVSTTGTYAGILLRNGDSNQAANATWPQIQFGWNGTSQYSHFIRTRHNSAATDNGIDFYVCNGTVNNSLTSGVAHGLTVDIDGVGIGTMNPSYKLHVVGDINFTGTLYQNGSAFSGGGGSSVWTTSGSNIYYNSGNVGIGTSSPVEKLHVYKNTYGESNVHIEAYSDTIGDRAALYLGTPHSGDPNAQPKCAIIADAVNSWSRADLHFCVETTASNSTVYRASPSNSRMMIDGFTGNVGIATTAPNYTLDVAGNINFTGTLYQNGSAFSGGGGSSVWTTSGSNIYYNSGNVSIGSSSSNGRLYIEPTGSSVMDNGIYVYNPTNSSGQDAIITLRVAGSSAGDPYLAFDIAGWASWACGVDTSDSHKFKWSSDWGDVGSNTKMTLDRYSGNLGIGTTSPSYKLHVVGDIYATGNVTAYSDVRNKKNLKTIEDPVSKIEKINGYTYEKDGIAYTGLVAQELLEVLPEAVSGSEELGYGIAYGNMAGIFVEAIKELNSKIKALENKLSQFV